MKQQTLDSMIALTRRKWLAEGALQSDCVDVMQLADFALGRLDGDRARRVIVHVAFCEGCLAELQAVAFAEEEAAAAPAPELDGTAGALIRETVARLGDALAELVSFEMPEVQPAQVFRSDEASEAASVVEGVRRYREGQHDAAVPFLERALQGSASSPELAYVLGACHLKARRIDEAIPLLESAAEQLGRAPAACWLLAQARLAGGDVAGALAELGDVASRPGRHSGRAQALVERLWSLLEAPDAE